MIDLDIDIDPAIERLQRKSVQSTLRFCITVLEAVGTKEQAIEVLQEQLAAPIKEERIA
jgi:hypothetical protein